MIRHFLIILLYLYTCFCYDISTKKCVIADHTHKAVNKSYHNGPKRCLNTTVCNRNYHVSYVDYPPYSDINIIAKHIERCCNCFKFTVTDLKNTEELTSSLLNKSDLIAPIANTILKPTLYGFYFIPIVKAPDYVYITLPPKSYSRRVLYKMKSTIPLICIVLLLAVIAGFCSWLIESRANSEQFPKPVFVGWFEGTWWSFISMTTVGYGDKTPRTIAGRLFAIIWVLIGITLFNMLTGVCTTAIESSQEPPEPSMKDARVGVLQHRVLDSAVVAKQGGLIVQTNMTSFYVDLVMLVQLLKENKIDGLVLDLLTYNALMFTIYPMLQQNNFIDFGPLQNKAKENFAYLLEETFWSQKPNLGEEYYYGFAIKDKEIYDYFSNAFNDNFINFNTWITLRVNQRAVQRLGGGISKEKSSFEFTDNYLILILVLVGTVLLQAVCAIVIRISQKKVRIRKIEVAGNSKQ